MARRAVRLLLAVVLAAVLFHPDAAVEGKEAPARPEGVVPYHRCGACEVDATKARSPVDKGPAIDEITGIAENVCKQEADDLQLRVFRDEERRCNAECRPIIERAWQEVMKDDKYIVGLIYEKKRSIQQLMEFLCKEDLAPAEPFSAKPSREDKMKNSPHSAEGEDDNNKIKKFGLIVKKLPVRIWKKLFQKEKPTNRAACKSLNASLE